MQRIILTRPAVEAGERLGFLPGDLMAKIDPYLRPLYDALYDMVEPEGAQKLLERQTVEVAPLAFMRGRTLNNSFIILDEAQNTTPEQMKMFLTRIGFGSKVVVTGDTTQVDVPDGRSGLRGLERVLPASTGSASSTSARRDVVRHRIVADIVAAYERADRRRDRPATADARRRPSRYARGGTQGRAATASREVFVRRRAARCRGRHRPLARRWPSACSRAEGVRGKAELSLLFVERGRDRRAQRAVHGQAGPDRRAGLPDRRRDVDVMSCRTRGHRGPDRAPPDPATCRCCSATS